MLVFRGFSRPAPAPTALTIGNFDGVHLGHRALLGQLKARAESSALVPAVLTFEPHPREFFAPVTAPARLSTLREKLELIAEAGIAVAYVCRFKAGMATCPADEFIADILVGRLGIRHLIVGDDFRFGAGRGGDFALLQRSGQDHGFSVESLPSVVVDGQRVSSSVVRQALADGRMDDAARLLGRPYAIDGRVVAGRQLGRQLGVPTANIRIKHRKPPLNGVFAVEVGGLTAGERVGIANIGFRPSVDHGASPLLEVHLFDFSGDLYGAHLSVRFLRKLRDEQKFADLAALKRQIARDFDSAKTYFALNH